MPPVGLYIIIIIMHVLSHQSERVCAASSGHFSRDHSRFAAVPLPIGYWPYVLTHEFSAVAMVKTQAFWLRKHCRQFSREFRSFPRKLLLR